MPTLNHSKTPEWQTWDQQDAEEAARQASGAPPSLPPGIHSGGVVAPPPADYGGYSNTNSVLTASGLETSFEPLPYNIGLLDDPEFCRLTETLLIIRESQSMFEGHEYQLKDSSGQVIIEVKGHAISLHDTKGGFRMYEGGCWRAWAVIESAFTHSPSAALPQTPQTDPPGRDTDTARHLLGRRHQAIHP
jgi:hypothetical protein